MTTFDDREKAQENKFAHDEELTFKAKVKAARFFAQWAAAELGQPADTYVNDLVNMVTAGKNEAALIENVQKQALAKGKNLSKEALSEKYTHYLNKAREVVFSR